MKATTKERRDKEVLSGYLRCCRVDLIGVCGLRGHKTGRQARDEGGCYDFLRSTGWGHSYS